MLWFSETVVEKEIDYTDCVAARFRNAANGTDMDESQLNGRLCHQLVNDPSVETCTCKVDDKLLTFNLEDMEGSVYIYYGLTNFYGESPFGDPRTKKNKEIWTPLDVDQFPIIRDSNNVNT